MPDRVATGNTNTVKKQRQRARIAAENPGRTELEVRAERADRLRDFLSQGRLKFADVEGSAQHICDLQAHVQQFQVARQAIMSLTVPSDYEQDALLVKKCGFVFLRVYVVQDIDAMLDEADRGQKEDSWETDAVGAVEKMLGL